MVAARASRVQAARVEQRADGAGRVRQVRERAAVERRGARGRGREPEQDVERGRLAGAVRAEQPDDAARRGGERHVVHGVERPVRLAQPGDVDGGHAGPSLVRPARASRAVPHQAVARAPTGSCGAGRNLRCDLRGRRGAAPLDRGSRGGYRRR
ncbi:Uncharacterised protein [Mycobacteroides abscessus]|nr:Uncharacterised protein [Mycobacteroides abscessus]